MSKFLIEIEEGETPDCEFCPVCTLVDRGYGDEYNCEWSFHKEIPCEKYDLRTLKINKQE